MVAVLYSFKKIKFDRGKANFVFDSEKTALKHFAGPKVQVVHEVYIELLNIDVTAFIA